MGKNKQTNPHALLYIIEKQLLHLMKTTEQEILYYFTNNTEIALTEIVLFVCAHTTASFNKLF